MFLHSLKQIENCLSLSKAQPMRGGQSDQRLPNQVLARGIDASGRAGGQIAKGEKVVRRQPPEGKLREGNLLHS